MLNLIKSDIVNKKNIKLTEKKSVKQFPSSVREWNNSIYVYNKNALNLIPYTTSLANNLIKSFFNLYNSKIERKMRTKRLLLRLRRLSLNKIFVSKGEFKHTNNKVTITLYVFNRQKRSYINRMKKLRFLFFFSLEKNNIAIKLIKESKLKILHYLKKAGKNEEFILNLINKNNSNSTATNFHNHIRDFYKKYAKKSYIYIKTFFFYKQLLYLNRTKYSYTYLKYLKTCLEKLYNKNVELNLINIKRFYLNSDIMSESLTVKLTKNRRKILAYLKDIRKKVKINKKKKFLLEPMRERIFNKNLIENTNLLSNNVTKKDIVFSELKYKDVTGFRLEAKGRLTKRFTASRSLTKFKYKGNLLNIDSSHRGLSTVLLKGNTRSNLQYTKLQSKTRIGSFGIKGWVSGN